MKGNTGVSHITSSWSPAEVILMALTHVEGTLKNAADIAVCHGQVAWAMVHALAGISDLMRLHSIMHLDALPVALSALFLYISIAPSYVR
jgi:hypothetical protein